MGWRVLGLFAALALPVGSSRLLSRGRCERKGEPDWLRFRTAIGVSIVNSQQCVFNQQPTLLYLGCTMVVVWAVYVLKLSQVGGVVFVPTRVVDCPSVGSPYYCCCTCTAAVYLDVRFMLVGHYTYDRTPGHR